MDILKINIDRPQRDEILSCKDPPGRGGRRCPRCLASSPMSSSGLLPPSLLSTQPQSWAGRGVGTRPSS
jgi:hypothetical protein